MLVETNNIEEKMTKRMYNEMEVSVMLGMSKSWLSSLRTNGKGPKFTKLGASVRYATEEIDKFVEENTVNSTIEYQLK